MRLISVIFRNKELYFTTILKIFIYMFVITFFVRLIGFDKFGLDVSGLNHIVNFVEKYKLATIFDIVTLFFSSFFILGIISKDKNKNNLIFSILITIFNLVLQLILSSFGAEGLYAILNPLIVYIFGCLINKKFIFKSFIYLTIMIFLYQFLALFIHDISLNNIYTVIYDIFIVIDVTVLLGITYMVKSMKGDVNVCAFFREVGSFLPQRILSKHSVKKSPKSSQNNLNNLSKEEKITNVIFITLSILWNLFTLFCVILVSTLNTSVITVIYILVSFLATKATFGKAFHMKNASTCFIVSNLTYYILSRITVDVKISMFIPIILGVSLSYITSFFVKNNEFKIYKNISEKELREQCELKKLTTYETNLVIDFYCKRMSTIKMAIKYHYSKDSIFMHKKKAVQKLKSQD